MAAPPVSSPTSVGHLDGNGGGRRHGGCGRRGERWWGSERWWAACLRRASPSAGRGRSATAPSTGASTAGGGSGRSRHQHSSRAAMRRSTVGCDRSSGRRSGRRAGAARGGTSKTAASTSAPSSARRPEGGLHAGRESRQVGAVEVDLRTMRSGPSDPAATPARRRRIRPMAAAVVSPARWRSAHRTRRWATRASNSTSPRRSAAPVVRTIDAPSGPARAAALPAGESITKRSGCSMPWVRHSPSTVLWSRGNSPTRAGRADRLAPDGSRRAPADDPMTAGEGHADGGMAPPAPATGAQADQEDHQRGHAEAHQGGRTKVTG